MKKAPKIFYGGRRGNKYHARRSMSHEQAFPELAGRSFASKLERDRGQELCVLQRAKEIRNLEFQPMVRFFEGTRGEVRYKPDFSYEEKRPGKNRCSFVKVWEEAKGKDMYPWMTNRKLWMLFGPGELRVMRRAANSQIKQTECIISEERKIR